MAEPDVAPAVVSRTHDPGTPRVTVRPYYGGPPSVAARGRTKAGESLPDREGKSLCPLPEDKVPRCKVAAMERCEAGTPAQRSAAPQGVD
jgi:hypothetical protein